MEMPVNIMIVDDNNENLYSLKNLLNPEEYNFILASSGEEALKSTLKNDIALILLDVQMPGMDGYEVARILKSSKKTENIPIIFITAIDYDVDNILRGFDVGALDYIFKPVNPVFLRAKVKNFVSLYKTQSELVRLNDELEERVAERTAELKKRNEELKKMNETLDNFIHVSAHDFRTPLSNISLIGNLLKSAKGTKEKMLLLNSLDTSIRLMEQTIRGIIEMVEVQENKHNPVRKIHLDELINDILKEYQRKKEETSARIQCDFQEAPSVTYIPIYMESIFRNLLSNAFKYHTPGRPLEIDVKSKEEGDFVLITFTDNGMGMDISNQRKNLFKPFVRYNKKIEGTGVGLYIVKNIVEMNGGNIFVSSVVEQGTTFFVYLKPYKIHRIEKKEEHTVVG
jgi:two-component system, sensor histidine kinase and response regulator